MINYCKGRIKKASSKRGGLFYCIFRDQEKRIKIIPRASKIHAIDKILTIGKTIKKNNPTNNKKTKTKRVSLDIVFTS